ncbi:MAG: extracellular solute-binding protein [Acidobacteriota bacterium]
MTRRTVPAIIGVAALVVLGLIAYFLPSHRAQPAERSLKIYAIEIWSKDLNREFRAICEQWGRNNNVAVDVELIPLQDADAKLSALVQTGGGADVAVFPAHKVPIYHRKLLDVTEIANELAKPFGGFYAIARDMNAVDGRLYGMPLYAWSHIWVYNSALLGGNPLPRTFEEAEQLALTLKPLTQKGVYPFGIGLGKDDDAAMFLQAVLWAYGGSVVAEDGHTITIRSPEAHRAFEYVLRLYQVDKVIPPGAFGWDGASNNKNFLAQQIAFTMNSPTILVAAKADAPDLATNIQHARYPSGPAGQYSYATGFSIACLRTTSKEDLIFSFLRYLYTRDNYARLISAGGGAVNPWLLGCEQLDIWNDPRMKVGLESLAIERHVGYPGPVTAAAAEVFDKRVLAQVINDVVNNSMTLDEALSHAYTAITSIYEQHRLMDNP